MFPGAVFIVSYFNLARQLGLYDTYLALILTTGPRRAPITVGLAELFGQYSINWNGIMAITSLVVPPLLVVFILVQRVVIAGITSGAVK